LTAGSVSVVVVWSERGREEEKGNPVTIDGEGDVAVVNLALRSIPLFYDVLRAGRVDDNDDD
jgi:hypothetical protein